MTDANPSGCCPPGRVAVITPPAEYSCEGAYETLGDMEVYIAGSPAAQKVIILLADIFGLRSGRHVNVADQLGMAGYYVYCPDLFLGDKASLDAIVPFLEKYPPEVWQPRMDRVYAHIQKLLPQAPICLMGFCWGCWAIFRESARGAPIIGGVNAHPSIRVEGFFGGTPEDLAAKVQHPQLMLSCSDDPENVKSGGAVTTTLASKTFGKLCSVREFASAHGFLSQGDVSDPAIANDVMAAMSTVEQWLESVMVTAGN